MWNEEHAFEISSEKEAMIEVFDKENVGQDKFMGELKVSPVDSSRGSDQCANCSFLLLCLRMQGCTIVA